MRLDAAVQQSVVLSPIADSVRNADFPVLKQNSYCFRFIIIEIGNGNINHNAVVVFRRSNHQTMKLCTIRACPCFANWNIAVSFYVLICLSVKHICFNFSHRAIVGEMANKIWIKINRFHAIHHTII